MPPKLIVLFIVGFIVGWMLSVAGVGREIGDWLRRQRRQNRGR